MPLRNAALSIAALASIFTAGCRDWRLTDESVAALSVEGRFGSEVDAVGEPELISSVMEDDYTFLEVRQRDGLGEVTIRILYEDALYRWAAERDENTPASDLAATRVEIDRVIDDERVVSEAPIVRVTLVSVENEEPEYEATERSDRYVYRVSAEWPDSQDRIEIDVELTREFERDPPPSDDDDEFYYEDDYYEDDWSNC